MNPSKLFRVEGIVLKRVNVGEADRIITIFTREQGKIRTIAKGIRRVPSRRAGHLEVFSHVNLLLRDGKMMPTVAEAQSASLHGLHEDLQKVSFGYYLCELVDRLVPEGVVHEDVFILLSNAFDSLVSEETAQEEDIRIFARALLAILGFSSEKHVSNEMLEHYIEGIIERRLRTPLLLTKI